MDQEHKKEVRKIQIRIAVVEDEAPMRAFLKEHAERFLSQKSLKGEVLPYESAEAFLADEGKKPSLVLMDIQMKGMDGMACARILRSRGSKAILLFITSLASYAVQGYQVDALDYLVKPVSPTDLDKSLTRALTRLKERRPRVVTLRSPGGVTVLRVPDILYVEAVNHSAVAHLGSGEEVPCGMTLSAMEAQLEGNGFFRCHAAFLINLSKIERITATDAVAEGRLIPVSKHRKKELMQVLAAWWGNQL